MDGADKREPEGYRRLEIYQLSHKYAIRVHALSMGLPAFELWEEGSQVRRSAKRVPAGIVEGYALRKYRNDFLRYLNRSLASSDETVEHLEILVETGSARGPEGPELISGYKLLSGKIASFIHGVERHHATPDVTSRHP